LRVWLTVNRDVLIRRAQIDTRTSKASTASFALPFGAHATSASISRHSAVVPRVAFSIERLLNAGRRPVWPQSSNSLNVGG
jgi:hypothetical protein